MILKDSSVRSIWTYLTASPTNTNMHDYTTNRYSISTTKQLINEISQSSYKCAEISELNFFHGHTVKFLGKHVIQTNPSKFDEKERETETERQTERESKVKERQTEKTSLFNGTLTMASNFLAYIERERERKGEREREREMGLFNRTFTNYGNKLYGKHREREKKFKKMERKRKRETDCESELVLQDTSKLWKQTPWHTSRERERERERERTRTRKL